ncbi:MAG TPA: phage holin family protein, partial [Staphylococcus saprophyticus]|nr:phage holin family protein [Staphylococcus saprophyticus]
MINIKTRLKNGATLTALISILALLGNQIAVLFGVDYSSEIEQLVNIAGTILLVLSSLGII